MPYRLFGILLLCFSPAWLFAGEIMFEGYYRIDLDNKPIGYTIQRYEFEPKSNTFLATSFLRAKFGEKIVQESLKAKATDKFQPVSYQYTSQIGEQMKMIDASFNGLVMTAKISDGKKVRTETSKMQKGSFLSSFLPYLLLQQKLELNQAFKYSGIAEEDGAGYWGKAWLQSRETKGVYEVYTVLNKFKGEEFISKMAVVKDPKNPSKNTKGEVLATSSPSKNISTKLTATPVQATEGQLVPNKNLVTLFGGVPLGKINMVAMPMDSEPAPPNKMIPTPVPAEKAPVVPIESPAEPPKPPGK